MDRDHNTPTRRVELSDGNWIELRTRILGADYRVMREAAHRRGFSDVMLDFMAALPGLTIASSFGEVTDEVVDRLPTDDLLKLLATQAEDTGPNPSTRSSGGGTRTSANRSRRSNG
jgi:hypothetical protein